MQQVRHAPFLLRVSTLPRRAAHPQADFALIYLPFAGASLRLPPVCLRTAIDSHDDFKAGTAGSLSRSQRSSQFILIFQIAICGMRQALGALTAFVVAPGVTLWRNREPLGKIIQRDIERMCHEM